jgi:5-methylcytosine-specific restriction endonuclease McrA
MDIVKAIDLRNRRDPHIAERDEVPQFRTRGPKQRQPCWELQDDMAMLDTALRGFACGPIYIIQDFEANIDDVFDGAHRCEALFKFIDNNYPITKSSKDYINWESSPLREHIGKKFFELPSEIQRKFKDYKFYINVIDPNTANDAASLGLLWERLSKAGKPLNKFETKSQTHTHLHKDILTPSTSSWLKTPFYSAEKSSRGQLEIKLNKLLALSEKEELYSYNSMDSLVERWSEEILGKNVDEIKKNTIEKKESFLERLRIMNNIMKELQDRNVLHDVSGNCLIDKSKDLIFLLILGRLGYWFPTLTLFRRVADRICPILKEIIVMNPNRLCEYLGVTSRNAGFQKKLIGDLDNKIKNLSELAKERRLFTPDEKKRKFQEQNGICPECSEPIMMHQRNAGDHIVEYCIGGKTTYENLQLLHKICHEQKYNKREL